MDRSGPASGSTYESRSRERYDCNLLQRYRKNESLSFDDILVSDSYSYYTTGSSSASEFDGEGQFTSAINSVTSEQTEKIYYTTGHGEATFSDSVTKTVQ